MAHSHSPSLWLRKSLEATWLCQQPVLVGALRRMQLCICKIPIIVKNQTEQGRFFPYQKIQNKPHSSIHFTGITSFQVSHYIPSLYQVKNCTSKGHYYSYETLSASSGGVCGSVALLLLLYCASKDFPLHLIKAQGTMVLKQNKKDFVDKDSHSSNISMQCLLENAPLIPTLNHALNFF